MNYIQAGEQGRERHNELMREAELERLARRAAPNRAKSAGISGFRALLVKILSIFTGQTNYQAGQRKRGQTA